MEQEKKEKKNLSKDEIKAIQKKSNKIVLITVAIVIAIILAIVGIVVLKQNIDEKKQIADEEARLAAQVEVPNVIGMTLNEASEALNNVDLEIKLTDYDKKLTESSPDEYVVDKQYPSAKEKVDKNTEISLYFKKTIIEKANTATGMSFKISREDYEKRFLEKYKDEISIAFADKNFTLVDSQSSIENTRFYCHSIYWGGGKTYLYRTPYFVTSIYEDINTDKIVSLSGTIVNPEELNENLLQTALTKDIINVFTSIDDSISENTMLSICSDLVQKNINGEEAMKYDNGILYTCNSFYSNNDKCLRIGIVAITEDKINILRAPSNSESTTNNNDNIKEDINNTISAINSSYGYNFQPTDEQMNELIEFYNLHKDIGDWGNDTLLSFLIDRGYVDEKSHSSNNSQTNQTTNNNSSQPSSTQEHKEPQATINVYVYPLSYLSNEEKEQISASNETRNFKITIKFNGKVIKEDIAQYKGGTYTDQVSYEDLKIDSATGSLEVEIDGKVVPYGDNMSADVNVQFYNGQPAENNFYFINKYDLLG